MVSSASYAHPLQFMLLIHSFSGIAFRPFPIVFLTKPLIWITYSGVWDNLIVYLLGFRNISFFLQNSHQISSELLQSEIQYNPICNKNYLCHWKWSERYCGCGECLLWNTLQLIIIGVLVLFRCGQSSKEYSISSRIESI